MKVVNFCLDLVPNKIQLFWISSLRHINIIFCSRQEGKTWFALFWLVNKLLFAPRKFPLGLGYSLTDRQVYKNLYVPLVQMLNKLPKKYWSSSKTDLEVKIRRPFVGDEIVIWFSGVENPHNLRGGTASALLIDEFAFMRKWIFFDVLIPFARHFDAPRLFISTLHFDWAWMWAKYMAKRMLDGADHIHVSENNIYTALGKSDKQIEEERKNMPVKTWQKEYMNDPDVGYGNLVYESEWNHISKKSFGNYKYNPTKPTFLLFDLGVGANLIAIAGQLVDGYYTFFDVYSGNDGEGLLQLTTRIKSENLNVSNIFFPWDGVVTSKMVGSDSVSLVKTIFPRVRVNVAVQAKPKSIRHDNARQFFYKCRFDRTSCYNDVASLAKFKYKENKTDGILNEPDGGRFSHFPDALSVLGGFGNRGIEQFLEGYIFNSTYKNKFKSMSRVDRVRRKYGE